MLKRKMEDRLRSWKESHGAKCLLINGARQVGKSFIVDRFGERSYDNYIKLDFVEHPEYRSVFDGSLSAERIYSNITLVVPGAHIVPGKTLLFLDEIQECPAARSSFKYLAQDGRCDVIGSGSLLGMRFRELLDAPSLPVGYEEQITMRPLDFEEFLWARGYDDGTISQLKSYLANFEPVPWAVHPTQSTIPEGGFGNLIALPFQGQAQRQSNSVFVDDNFTAHSDQWRFLSSVSKVSAQRAQELVDSVVGNPLGQLAFTGHSARITGKPAGPDYAALSLQIPNSATGDFPKTVSVTKAKPVEGTSRTILEHRRQPATSPDKNRQAKQEETPGYRANRRRKERTERHRGHRHIPVAFRQGRPGDSAREARCRELRSRNLR